MPLGPGTRLGPYEILAPLEGDAAESYKATDTRLNRMVTIKLFPLHALEDSQARERLEREVKTIAALNHPNICALYDLGQEAETGYLVTEHLEGETLEARLEKGPMELGEALGVAIQLAEALDKAHRQGVTHRGLNPSSVIITQSAAKLTDFGFARLREPAGRAVSSFLSTRTLASPSASLPVSVAAYLAPEQYDGAESDARTDIFAFGALLYEMVTGQPAFEGKTHAILLAAIQSVDPEPMSKLQPMTPPALEFLVKRCLAKDPKQRLQTARDLVSHLRWIGEGGSQAGIPAPLAARRQKRDRLFAIGAAALLLLAAGIAPSAYRYFEGSPPPEDVHFGLYSMTNSGQGAGGTTVYISPNGRWIASSRPAAVGGMYLLETGSVTPKLMLESHATYLMFWAPDGRSFAFFDDGKLWATDISGAPPRIVCDAPEPVGGGAWSRDGVIVFSSGGALYRVLAGGGVPQQISTPKPELQENEHAWPYFLPDGRHYVYLSTAAEPTKSAIYVGELDSTKTVRLLASESRAAYAAPGYLLFNRGNAVFAQAFDAEALQLRGEARRLVDANLRITVAQTLVASQSRQANFDVSQTGTFVYRSGSVSAGGAPGGGPSMRMTWFDRSGSVTQVEAPGVYAGVDLAPDGQRFAVHKHEGTGGDSWFFSGGRLQRLTFNVAQDNSMPIWSRDGKRIAFGSLREGKWGIYIKASDGTGTEQLVVESELPKMPMSWSAGDKELVYWVSDPRTRGDIWMIPLEGSDREARVLLQTHADELYPAVSPDGKWMVYQSDVNSTPQIYVEPFPDGAGNRSQISVEGGTFPRWHGDTQELFYVFVPNVMAAELRFSGLSVEAGVPRALFPLRGNPNVPHTTPYHRYAVTRDGQRFLIPQPVGAPTGAGGVAGTISSIVDQQVVSGGNVVNPGAINVILNWTRRLDRQ